jgi:lipoprotein NlpD
MPVSLSRGPGSHLLRGAGGVARGAVLLAPLLAALLVPLVGVLSGCASQTPAPVFGWDEKAPAPEGYYRVKRGDTLSEVAERLKLDFASLARWNGLSPPYKIVSGGLLRMAPPTSGGAAVSAAPADDADRGGGQPAGDKGKGAAKAADAVPRSATKVKVRSEDGAPATGSGLAWQWPLRGAVKQTFVRGDRTRSGIRIAGRPGDQAVAAEAGSVVYSGSGLKGYGNLIIVRHNKNYLSAYGFNRRLLVREGDQVKRGQAVAEIGQAAGGSWLLHFEIRKNGTAVDPLGYLPRSR